MRGSDLPLSANARELLYLICDHEQAARRWNALESKHVKLFKALPNVIRQAYLRIFNICQEQIITESIHSISNQYCVLRLIRAPLSRIVKCRAVKRNLACVRKILA